MTPKFCVSPKPLTIYPHLHRNSQCRSCCTVMPGDICFNCGRLSTLLVTPRPPLKPTGYYAPAPHRPPPAQSKRLFQSKPFDSQHHRTQALLSAHNRAAQACAQQRAFDRQLSEVDDLLDARHKLANVHTLAANDSPLTNDRYVVPSHEHFTGSSNPFPNSSTAHAIYSSGSASKTLRSGSIAESDLLAEGGRPHAHVVARWLKDMKPSERSESRLTRRGVDCRLNINGKVCEWVIFL